MHQITLMENLKRLHCIYESTIYQNLFDVSKCFRVSAVYIKTEKGLN